MKTEHEHMTEAFKAFVGKQLTDEIALTAAGLASEAVADKLAPSYV